MVIPLHDANPTRRFPVVTVALIVVNLVVYFGIQLPRQDDPSDRLPISGFSEADEQVLEYAAVPCELKTGEPETYAEYLEHECNAEENFARESIPAREIFPDKNIWLGLVYSMFLHATILHVLGNMLFLWIFGNNVEDRLGPILYFIFYIAAGLAAAAAHVAFNLDSTIPILGASGAIAGVMGAYLVWYPHARILSVVPLVFLLFPLELPAAVVLGLWFVMQFFTNPNEGVAWLAHVGGFAFGAAVAYVLRNVLPPPPPPLSRPQPRWGRRRFGGGDDDDWDGGFRGGYPGRM
jgi:membrane associated rhomboid family serine protease